MLPSVSAGSAALTKYAQAIAVTASERTPDDAEDSPRAEQEAARQNADNRSASKAESGTLARDAGETVKLLLELMRHRVLTALLDLGVSEAVAMKAADAAVVKLAETIAASGQLAAEIVHALLEKPLTGKSDPIAPLLHLTARDLTVIIDHETGDVRVTLPDAKIAATAGHHPSDRHLIDFTDRSPAQAAPVLAALGAVHEIAREVAAAAPAVAGANPATAGSPGSLFVSPRAVADAVATRLSALPEFARTDAAMPVADIARAVGHVISAAVNGTSPESRVVPVAEIFRSVATLSAASPSDGAAHGPAPLAFSGGKIAFTVDAQNGTVTVRVGDRITAFSPTALATPAMAQAPLPGLEALPLPIIDIPASLPTGKVVDVPGGLPFVPPQIEELPVPGGPVKQVPDTKPQPQTARPATDDGLALLLDPAVLRDATVIGNVATAPGGETAQTTRVSFDISAEFAPGSQAAQPPATAGSLGRSRPLPDAAQDGPVQQKGYADAAANLIPVLPALHARGLMQPVDAKPKPRKPAKGPYGQRVIEDAFERDMPEGHEGLVFSTVVFSA